MKFHEKICILRNQANVSQEKLAEMMGVSRQSVTKWENGQSLPEVDKIVMLSDLFGITVDELVKEGGCEGGGERLKVVSEKSEVLDFLLQAKKHTYAATLGKTASSRPASSDYEYKKDAFQYIDSFLGSTIFSGQEAVWKDGCALWSMEYHGRVLDETFSGDFLKEALYQVPAEYPYRGPLLYQKGAYVYHNLPQGGFEWFQGTEEIYCNYKKVYECYYMGGNLQ